MYIAIDDTYGPTTKTDSKYVTGARRTSVGVAFPDSDIADIREQMLNCLEFVKTEFSVEPREFHFVDIYNRKSPWDRLPERANLAVFSCFAEIYLNYKWKVFIQTIDERTLSDFGIHRIKAKVNQFNLEKASDLSLFWLLIKIKKFYLDTSEDLFVLVDEGLGKPRTPVGNEIFHNFPNRYTGEFRSSSQEPLLQLADFFAFTINRSTHLYMKKKRTKVDEWFLRMFSQMNINSDDLTKVSVIGELSNLTVSHFDEVHKLDRTKKGIKTP